MQINGFHHIGLYVDDVPRCLAFYTEGLGGKEIFSFPTSDTGRLIYLVELGGGAVVEIVPRGTGEAQQNARWAHIALDTSDTRATYARAIAAGATSRIPPQDVMLGTMSVCNAFVVGPGGESIEFFQVKA